MLAMDTAMVEENGSVSGDPLAHSPGEVNPSVVTVTSVQSVIQPNQQSVIQTPANIQPVQITKGNVILVGKPNSVIQSGPGSLQTLQVQPARRRYRRILPKPSRDGDPSPAPRPASPTQRDILRQLLYDNLEDSGPTAEDVSEPTVEVKTETQHSVVDAGSDDSLSNDDESTKKRRDILTRRPSYRKILNDLGGGEIAVRQLTGPASLNHRLTNERSVAEESNAISRFSANRGDSTSDEEDSELSSHSIPTHYQTVIPAGAIQISSQGGEVQGLHTLTMTNATTAGGTIVQYTQGQDGQFFVPGEYVVTQGGGISGSPIIAEDQQRKREMRLLKNREAARECRRKKKEYIKCLENRVAVLENQNKALIDELKTLKELYCQQKTE